MAHPGMQVVLVHGEEKAQQILSGLIKDQFHLSVYAPGYLEEMALAAGATPEVVVTAQPKSYAHVDWDLLLEETEGKLSKLRTRLEKAGDGLGMNRLISGIVSLSSTRNCCPS